MEEEIWKDVCGFDGIYQASNLGRVKSLSRDIWNGRVYVRSKERILRPGQTGKSGYWQLVFRKDGRSFTMMLHRAVMLAFEPNVDHGLDVAHKDGNPSNNNLENLYWATRTENMADAIKHGNTQRGEKMHMSIITKDQAIAIYNDERKQQDIATEYRISRGNVSAIKRGLNWSWATGATLEKNNKRRECARRAKLTEEIAIKIYNEQGSNFEIAVKYGCSPTMVWQIKTKRAWRIIHNNN